jgi:hypothetical protein
MFLGVDRVEGLRSTNKLQFGERFCQKQNFSPPLSAIPTDLYPPRPPQCFPSPTRRDCKSITAVLPRWRGEVKGREAGAGRDDRLCHPALHHSPAAASRRRMEGREQGREEAQRRCTGSSSSSSRRPLKDRYGEPERGGVNGSR